MISLAASRDGQTLYYSAEGSIWAIPLTDGTPRKIVQGDGVVVDPNNGDLIVNSLGKSGERLYRVPAAGGPAQPIAVRDGITIVPLSLAANSLDRRRRLLTGVTSPDSWFFDTAVLDLETGRVERIPLTFTGDILDSSWAADGRVLALAEPMPAHDLALSPDHHQRPIARSAEIREYSSLFRGMLFGTWASDKAFGPDDVRSTHKDYSGPRFQRHLQAVAEIRDLATLG